MQLELPSESDTLAFGERLGRALQGPAVIFLRGDLGAGKTTLCRGLLRALGHGGSVRSPTYTLVEPYELHERALYHFDLYRLLDPMELEELGIRDYLDPQAVLLFEWPDRGGAHLPAPDIELRLEPCGSGRRVVCAASSVTGRAIVTRMGGAGDRA